MRKVAPLLLVLTLAALASPGLAAENLMLVGKSVSWETWGEEPKGIVPNATLGEAVETPNQRRRRLGIAIEATFPVKEAEVQGVAEETPNHRRQREAQNLAKAQ